MSAVERAKAWAVEQFDLKVTQGIIAVDGRLEWSEALTQEAVDKFGLLGAQSQDSSSPVLQDILVYVLSHADRSFSQA